LAVIGVNSIAAYVISHTMKPFINSSLHIHLGQNFDRIFGATYSTLVAGTLVLFVEWLILYWMNKKKIFIKI
jgi:predicted acyltransferase